MERYFYRLLDMLRPCNYRNHRGVDMAIVVNVSGNGSAWVDDNNPEPNQEVTLFAYANGGETLDDIYATDSGGHAIALSIAPVQTFRYNTAWGTMTINVEFSGSTPPVPYFMPAWLILAIKRRIQRNEH